MLRYLRHTKPKIMCIEKTEQAFSDPISIRHLCVDREPLPPQLGTRVHVGGGVCAGGGGYSGRPLPHPFRGCGTEKLRPPIRSDSGRGVRVGGGRGGGGGGGGVGFDGVAGRWWQGGKGGARWQVQCGIDGGGSEQSVGESGRER